MPERSERRRRLTDRELDELSRVGPEDVERAKAAWRRYAPARWRELLDARPIGEEPPASTEDDDA